MTRTADLQTMAFEHPAVGESGRGPVLIVDDDATVARSLRRVLEARDFHDLLAGYLGRADALGRLSHLRLSSHRRLDEVVERVQNVSQG